MKLKVAVIFGGESVEHDISIISAMQAINALDKNKYEVIPLYLSKDRDLYYGNELYDIKNFRNKNLISKLTKVYLVKHEGKVLIEPIKKGLFSKSLNSIDVVIPIVHGTNGEDGVLQGYLELLKVPYSSSDVISSAVGQDKVVMKSVLQQAGIKMVDWFWTYGFEVSDLKDEIKEKALKIGYPLIVKPACLGSSIGIEFADNYEELLEAIDNCSKFDFKVIIEKRLKNFREINCSVLGSIYKCKAGVLEEVTLEKNDTTRENDFLDFDGKYGPKGKKSGGMASTKRIVPAPIGEELTDKIKKLAVKTFKQIGANGVCRIDFLIDENGEVLVNEINNIPGSLAYYLWNPVGVDFTALMDELIELALSKANKKGKLIYTFESSVLEGFDGVKGKMGSKN